MIVAYDPNKLWEMLKRVSESALPFFAPGGTSLVRELAAKMLFCSQKSRCDSKFGSAMDEIIYPAIPLSDPHPAHSGVSMASLRQRIQVKRQAWVLKPAYCSRDTNCGSKPGLRLGRVRIVHSREQIDCLVQIV